ncbi:hypothetical protein [Paeniglutamicibacter terrestris]|uniref:Uncharacterized protein n=1 Tax=Paeniglutamicibacter terrestris TaxID=2723403 RepID=A0ABX1G123_9MICC|nr:hypothetical protein [Paeniglutamicibacter terrestris]ASN37871.1 hypothetical protein CGQ24_01850 [Arthrobacter sp. 7749]NKG19934.1 hypothetical protein [Paeniglutamicibacter terrestris]
MMFLGVPASNGVLPIHMEPAFFAWLLGFLPMPAAVESSRSVRYFDGDVVGHHLLAFGIWGAISLGTGLYHRQDQAGSHRDPGADAPRSSPG